MSENDAVALRYRRRNPLALAAAAAGALFATVPAAADEPQRPVYYDSSAFPPGSTRYKLALTGAGITAAWYGAAYGFSRLWPEAPGAGDLKYPVVGPWMALADTGCADDDPDCSTFIVVLRAILTTMDGVGQAGGVAVIGEALFLPTASAAAPPRRRRAPRPGGGSDSFRLRPTPVASGKNGIGIGIAGTF